MRDGHTQKDRQIFYLSVKLRVKMTPAEFTASANVLTTPTDFANMLITVMITVVILLTLQVVNLLLLLTLAFSCR